MYIIPLREPFSRFISEAINQADVRGVGVDWSLYAVRKNLYYKDFETIHNSNKIVKIVNYYARLPMQFTIHNRHSKMIGGQFSEFNYGFDGQKEIGTTWLPNDTKESITKVMENAYQILSYHSSVIIGSHAKFAEMICTIEIVFGHIYKFKWNPLRHSHTVNGKYKRNEERERVDRFRSEMHSELLGNWTERNEADIELYARSVQLFDVQFAVALDILRNHRTHSMANYPHCIPFIDYNVS